MTFGRIDKKIRPVTYYYNCLLGMGHDGFQKKGHRGVISIKADLKWQHLHKKIYVST